jgi:hypothetical protein
MCALNGFQLLASNAKCTYLRKSVGTLLYLSIRGVQGVNIINVMLMTVHAHKKKCFGSTDRGASGPERGASGFCALRTFSTNKRASI